MFALLNAEIVLIKKDFTPIEEVDQGTIKDFYDNELQKWQFPMILNYLDNDPNFKDSLEFQGFMTEIQDTLKNGVLSFCQKRLPAGLADKYQLIDVPNTLFQFCLLSSPGFAENARNEDFIKKTFKQYVSPDGYVEKFTLGQGCSCSSMTQRRMSHELNTLSYLLWLDLCNFYAQNHASLDNLPQFYETNVLSKNLTRKPICITPDDKDIFLKIVDSESQAMTTNTFLLFRGSYGLKSTDKKDIWFLDLPYQNEAHPILFGNRYKEAVRSLMKRLLNILPTMKEEFPEVNFFIEKYGKSDSDSDVDLNPGDLTAILLTLDSIAKKNLDIESMGREFEKWNEWLSKDIPAEHIKGLVREYDKLQQSSDLQSLSLILPNLVSKSDEAEQLKEIRQNITTLQEEFNRTWEGRIEAYKEASTKIDSWDTRRVRSDFYLSTKSRDIILGNGIYPTSLSFSLRPFNLTFHELDAGCSDESARAWDYKNSTYFYCIPISLCDYLEQYVHGQNLYFVGSTNGIVSLFVGGDAAHERNIIPIKSTYTFYNFPYIKGFVSPFSLNDDLNGPQLFTKRVDDPAKFFERLLEDLCKAEFLKGAPTVTAQVQGNMRVLVDQFVKPLIELNDAQTKERAQIESAQTKDWDEIIKEHQTFQNPQ